MPPAILTRHGQDKQLPFDKMSILATSGKINVQPTRRIHVSCVQHRAPLIHCKRGGYQRKLSLLGRWRGRYKAKIASHGIHSGPHGFEIQSLACQGGLKRSSGAQKYGLAWGIHGQHLTRRVTHQLWEEEIGPLPLRH